MNAAFENEKKEFIKIIQEKEAENALLQEQLDELKNNLDTKEQ